MTISSYLPPFASPCSQASRRERAAKHKLWNSFSSVSDSGKPFLSNSCWGRSLNSSNSLRRFALELCAVFRSAQLLAPLPCTSLKASTAPPATCSSAAEAPPCRRSATAAAAARPAALRGQRWPESPSTTGPPPSSRSAGARAMTSETRAPEGSRSDKCLIAYRIAILNSSLAPKSRRASACAAQACASVPPDSAGSRRSSRSRPATALSAGAAEPSPKAPHRRAAARARSSWRWQRRLSCEQASSAKRSEMARSATDPGSLESATLNRLANVHNAGGGGPSVASGHSSGASALCAQLAACSGGQLESKAAMQEATWLWPRPTAFPSATQMTSKSDCAQATALVPPIHLGKAQCTRRASVYK
mmetsp:Transcript_5214/g.19587  ORF Transcript_5214/g.19587 Transcript_5214/m.19587 type:complete len:362 (+) Transcript_5214:482-1567(+)